MAAGSISFTALDFEKCDPPLAHHFAGRYRYLRQLPTPVPGTASQVS